MNARAIFMRGLPLWYFLLLFFFYGYRQVSFSMMNKIAGLLALMLLGTSFLIGPLSYFLPQVFTQFKIYRKYLGISGFAVAVIHALLSFYSYFNMNLAFMLFDSKNEHLLGVWLGILAILIFLTMTVTSTKKAIEMMGAANWKKLQTGGYLALGLVMAHFIFMETNNGLFIILVVLIARLLVLLLSLKKKKKNNNE
ncbi:ferric reductase-like transmembrane domain-containing protein [Candidatus Microgenomates bacterium]|nr:ferric reductase-like transmembrane domain-containing protein [Candidatus Microgenomates bacterium]